MAPDTADPIAELRRLFAERGDSGYGGEAVSQRDHALQAAALARAAGARAELVAAALLHDVGHLLHDLPDDAPDAGLDDRHEGLAARWLARWFGPGVVAPIRMHVAAKRYLCAAEPGYFDGLSRSSVVSLRLQGGPMSAEEARRFRESPHFADAVALRRWDDTAKDTGAVVPDFESYVPTLREAIAARPATPTEAGDA